MFTDFKIFCHVSPIVTSLSGSRFSHDFLKDLNKALGSCIGGHGGFQWLVYFSIAVVSVRSITTIGTVLKGDFRGHCDKFSLSENSILLVNC
mmetsp:Transcript_16962/g.25904  ORF Transcript_16962/g.25904 Transcript_16962/m.25904 type:complete len:92 (+) Transcript_16962:134-409(+)